MFYVVVQDKLPWLKNHIDPWPQVLLYWGDTYDARLNQLQEGTLTSAQYLESYAALQFYKGYELVKTLSIFN